MLCGVREQRRYGRWDWESVNLQNRSWTRSTSRHGIALLKYCQEVLPLRKSHRHRLSLVLLAAVRLKHKPYEMPGTVEVLKILDLLQSAV
jgi:hypothetical protein